MVSNRFLLWGLSGALWSILEIVDTAQYVVYEATGEWAAALNLPGAWLEAVPGGMVWLIFFPPAFYRRWLSRRVPEPKRERG